MIISRVKVLNQLTGTRLNADRRAPMIEAGAMKTALIAVLAAMTAHHQLASSHKQQPDAIMIFARWTAGGSGAAR